jgi:tetratricopeptide (TPR) repeat protein
MPATAAADDESLAGMQRGLDGYLAFGGLMGRPYYFHVIAEAAAHCGRREEAERALAAALAAAGTGERVWTAELHRLQGELALADGGGEERAESCFARALAVARSQGATLLELRAAASLGRLEAARGKREEARRRLAEVYGRFAEGFETRDLQAARELLADWTDSCQGVPAVRRYSKS